MKYAWIIIDLVWLLYLLIGFIKEVLHKLPYKNVLDEIIYVWKDEDLCELKLKCYLLLHIVILFTISIYIWLISFAKVS